jgi:hypothetical protein
LIAASHAASAVADRSHKQISQLKKQKSEKNKKNKKQNKMGSYQHLHVVALDSLL